MREPPINWLRKHRASCTVHKDARGATGRSPETSELRTKTITELGAAGPPPARPTDSQKEQQLLTGLPGRREQQLLPVLLLHTAVGSVTSASSQEAGQPSASPVATSNPPR